MVFGILFVGVAVFIIIQAVIRNGSSSNKSTFDRNRQNDAANMSLWLPVIRICWIQTTLTTLIILTTTIITTEITRITILDLTAGA